MRVRPTKSKLHSQFLLERKRVGCHMIDDAAASSAKPKRNYRLWLMVVVPAAIVAILYYSGFISGLQNGLEGHGFLPSCSRAESDLKTTFENPPFAASGLRLVAVLDAMTISSDPKKVECKATAILSNSQKAIIDYSFTTDPSFGFGKYYVRIFVEPDSLKPYP
jgi:hypothetical protein